MYKSQISNFLRKLQLLYLADCMRFYQQRIKNKKINTTFKLNNPNVKLPPDYLIYESFQLNYYKYYFESKITAENLTNHFKSHINLYNKRILDWGCGPGRIIRHLPHILGEHCEYYGTDYNSKSIDWCSKNLPNIKSIIIP